MGKAGAGMSLWVDTKIWDLAEQLAEEVPLAIRAQTQRRLAKALQRAFDDWWTDVEEELQRDTRSEKRLRDRDRAGD